MYQINSE